MGGFDPKGWGSSVVRYDAFISYSHAVDGELARDLQHGLERLSKPWYRRKPFMRVFRDETSFTPGADLGDKIVGALDSADHLVLLLSPESARSPWVNAELTHWLRTKSKDDITIVITEWDGPEGVEQPKSLSSAAAEPNLRDFDWDGEDVPRALRGQYAEPLAVDMRWAPRRSPEEPHSPLRTNNSKTTSPTSQRR